ncbi:MAG: IS1380 family transposase, partial [Chloroflexota bacterium]
MTECKQISFGFPTCKSRKVLADFKGGDVTSDGGVLLLRQVDKRLGLTRRLSEILKDSRSKGHCDHDQLRLLRQRIYALALGYEDVNDHSTLRKDTALQTAVEASEDLASAPTLCRWENRADRETAIHISELLVEQFIMSFKKSPDELVLDFDATDDPVHGKQEGRFFHGYYDHYCFLPLYVFCGEQLLVSYLRPSNIDAARHAWAILSLLVKRFRQAWPGVKIII